MMTRASLAVLLSLSALLLSLDSPRRAEAAGPWQAQVVSAETKQPLEGVVVLAWWTRHVRSFGGPSEEYRDSQEVLTDKDGRFSIDSRWFFSLNPLVFFRGPFFAMFKSGMGTSGGQATRDRRHGRRKSARLSETAAELLQLEGSFWRCRCRLKASNSERNT